MVGEKLKLMLTQFSCAGAGTELGKKKRDGGLEQMSTTFNGGRNSY